MKEKRRIILAAALVLAAAAATFVLFSLERSRQLSGQEASEPVDIETQVQEARADETIPVTLYFHRPGAIDPARGFLASEKREIPNIEDPALRARQIIAELFKGRSNGSRAFPDQARLRQFYLLEDGTAVVDLSQETADGLPAGITSELAVIYSITRSLRENLEEVKRVLFLVEGQSQSTLGGHISIADPFR